MTQTLSTPQENRLKRNQRRIVKRIIVYGKLVLETPTCLGSGDAESPTDMPVLRDSVSDRALLTGASLAGALRNYLWEYKNGYNQALDKPLDKSVKELADLLFGGARSDDDGDQSPLIVDDALSSSIPVIELRDGVQIVSNTGTANDGAKYDLEFIAAGTEFKLGFELLIEQEHDEAQLCQALTLALRGLENGEISMGTKKRRGFGRCQVTEWQVWKFDLRQDQDRTAWLMFDHATRDIAAPQPSIVQALGLTLEQADCRDRFCLHATFALDSPILIRSGQNAIGLAPDVVHLKSWRSGADTPQPILSGTSLTGVMRHRAERILNTLGKSTAMLKQIFGFVDEDKLAEPARASRLVVHESVVAGKTHDLVQNRVAIDRFTGGAYHGALFSEQPVFGTNETTVNLELELRNPKDEEIGLLLLLLKDLWTGDLPVGGGRSIGRGRLKGQNATITRHYPDSTVIKSWTITQQGESLEVSDAEALEAFVQALVAKIGGEKS
jgi:CRISPR/Cas system CSM-associated protein Csm3 (group 7 of RAMP superfamily)